MPGNGQKVKQNGGQELRTNDETIASWARRSLTRLLITPADFSPHYLSSLHLMSLLRKTYQIFGSVSVSYFGWFKTKQVQQKNVYIKAITDINQISLLYEGRQQVESSSSPSLFI